ncbi:hypothetical protein [Nocardia sp. alder85J]|uniref:hypothetical protein n=1 Tax=Nocardia sp. alder85J TaxID=2862949 RepID=UPI001CD42B3E|nr:hypothetical protein [Nocardia sp. alder85J]MCX4098426.1 hypothetical protein [Nocardia sp. alder85J]
MSSIDNLAPTRSVRDDRGTSHAALYRSWSAHTRRRTEPTAHPNIWCSSPSRGHRISRHVGIYVSGNNSGNDLILNAPDYRQKVKVEPLTDWKGERWGFRRFGTTTPPASADPST